VPVVCAQNGVTNETEAAKSMRRVYGTLVFLPATYLVPGEVAIHAHPVPGLLDTGLYPRGRDDLADTVCGDFERAGFIAQAHERIMSLKYRKLLHNIANVTQALCGPDADAGDLAEELRREGAACLQAAGVDLAPMDEYERRVSRIAFVPIDDEPRAGSSIWQSLERRTGTTEVDFLNGDGARLGEAHGCPAPPNRTVQRLMHEATSGGLRPGSYRPSQVLALARDTTRS
jgi:2-dehydropantoate 2-reductase